MAITETLTDLLKRLFHVERRLDRIESLESPVIAGGGGVTGAPSNAPYVTIGNTAALSAERALTEGPDIDLVDGGANSTITVGRGGDTILLFDSGGSPLAEFAATEAGLTAALAAATSGDTVWLPSITIGGDHTLIANVAVIGASRFGSILSGQVTGASGARLENCSVTRSANDANALYGIVAPGAGTTMLAGVHVSVTQAGAGNAAAIYAAAGGNVEAWNCSLRAPAGGAGWHYGVYHSAGNIYQEGGVCIGFTGATNWSP
jgi:hypothetical protein